MEIGGSCGILESNRIAMPCNSQGRHGRGLLFSKAPRASCQRSLQGNSQNPCYSDLILWDFVILHVPCKNPCQQSLNQLTRTDIAPQENLAG